MNRTDSLRRSGVSSKYTISHQRPCLATEKTERRRRRLDLLTRMHGVVSPSGQSLGWVEIPVGHSRDNGLVDCHCFRRQNQGCCMQLSNIDRISTDHRAKDSSQKTHEYGLSPESDVDTRQVSHTATAALYCLPPATRNAGGDTIRSNTYAASDVSSNDRCA